MAEKGPYLFESSHVKIKFLHLTSIMPDLMIQQCLLAQSLELIYNFVSDCVWWSQNTNQPGETGIVSRFFPAPSSDGTATDCSPFKLSPHGGDEATPVMGSEFLPTSDSFVSMETNPPTGPIKKYLVNFSMRASHCGLRSGSLWMLITTARPT